MDEGQDTGHGSNDPSTPGPEGKSEPLGEDVPYESSDEYQSAEDMSLSLSDKVDYLLALTEHQNLILEHQTGFIEAQVEALMRVYDAVGLLISGIEGDRRLWDGLREQHKEGDYHFPPFYLAGNYYEDEEGKEHE